MDYDYTYIHEEPPHTLSPPFNPYKESKYCAHISITFWHILESGNFQIGQNLEYDIRVK